MALRCSATLDRFFKSWPSGRLDRWRPVRKVEAETALADGEHSG
jgi:hypothetical protein